MEQPKKSIAERLEELFARLQRLPSATSADEALRQICDTLEAVEDEFSGVPRKHPPPSLREKSERLYPPRSDSIDRYGDGSIVARTAGHFLELSPDGGIVIRNRRSKEIALKKSGAKS